MAMLEYEHWLVMAMHVWSTSTGWRWPCMYGVQALAGDGHACVEYKHWLLDVAKEYHLLDF